ncbi:MAG: hypothetical protein Q7I89_01380 [Syntrophales bacterium]|nr:hypothetical protein [Syntrophales bacterium]
MMITKRGVEMNPMERLLSIIGSKVEGRIFNTLGKRSTFTAENRSNRLIIINSRGNEYEVKEELARVVSKRYDTSPIEDKYRASNYVDQTWKGCPNRVYSPYIAAIFRAIELRMPDKMA